MMNKSYNDSNRVTLIAPAGGVIGGRFYKIGALFGCAVASAPAGKLFTLDRDGVWAVPVEAAGAITVGAPIYFEAGRADAEFSNEATAGAIQVGEALGAVADATVATIDVVISPRALSTAAEAVEQAGGADA